MANESIMGLFSNYNPQRIRNEALDSDMVSNAQMGSQGLLQQVVSMGRNAGTMTGDFAGRLLGGVAPGEAEAAQVEDVFQQVSNIASPLGQAQAAYSLFTEKNMPKQAQAMLARIRSLEQESLDDEYKQARIDNYSKQSSSGGQGTGTERMLAVIGDVRRRLMQGEVVPEWELAQAQDMIQQLGKPKTYEDDQGRLVTISQSQVSPLPTTGKRGEATGVSEKGGAVVTETGGARVTETPEFTERQKQLVDSREKALGNFQIGLDRIDEIMANTDFTRGILGGLAALNPTSEAASQRRALQTIIAKTVTETLSTLKEQSKTGATGFGALSAPELEIIQSAITSLDPMDPRFDARLLELRNRWEAAMNKIREAQPTDNSGNMGQPPAEKPERKPLSSFKRD